MKATWLFSLVIAALGLAAILGPSMAGAGDNSGQAGQGAPPAGMVRQEAPIEGVSVRIAESAPPQYFAEVEYGLPSGCAKPGDHQVKRSGNTITITIWNYLPADANTICTMIYGYGKHSVPLGSDFTSGQTYTVVVNDKRTTFTAQ